MGEVFDALLPLAQQLTLFPERGPELSFAKREYIYRFGAWNDAEQRYTYTVSQSGFWNDRKWSVFVSCITVSCSGTSFQTSLKCWFCAIKGPESLAPGPADMGTLVQVRWEERREGSDGHRESPYHHGLCHVDREKR